MEIARTESPGYDPKGDGGCGNRDPLSYLDDERQYEHPWRQKCATLAGLADEVIAVLEDQVREDRS